MTNINLLCKDYCWDGVIDIEDDIMYALNKISDVEFEGTIRISVDFIINPITDGAGREMKAPNFQYDYEQDDKITDKQIEFNKNWDA